MRLKRGATVLLAICLAALFRGPQAAAQDDSEVKAQALTAAQARQRDAESFAMLSADGRLLYEREKLKLGGFQYCSQAVALSERGDFRQSIRAASKALYLGQQSKDATLLASSYRDLAIAYSYAGNLERALEFAKKALEQPDSDAKLIRAPANKVLGDVALRSGKASDAIVLYRTALQLASTSYRPVVETSLANAYVALPDLAAARSTYDAIKPPTDPALKQIYLRGIGQLLIAENKPVKALEVFSEALALASGLDAAYHRLWAHEGIGRAHLLMNDQTKAAIHYAAAVAAADAARARFRSEEFKSALFGDVQEVFERAMALSMATGDQVGAFNISEKGRSRELLDLVRERIPTKNEAASTQKTVALDVNRVMASLKQGEVLVQYHTAKDRLFVWTVRHDEVKGFELPVSRQALATQITRFRDAVLDRKATVVTDGRQLYKQLIDPLQIRPGERLVIVPHGPLHYLAFQALLDGTRFLIEKHAVAIAPSASLAVDTVTRNHQSKAAPLVAFGNPATKAEYALPGAEREVQQISGLFQGGQVFLRTDATRKRFKETAGNGRILHVAAHASADEVDSLFSQILLAQDGNDPGFLEAREIYGLDLRGVSLVTLSACESGLGSSARGDEVLGFTRAFLAAGASSLVASLWPVDDDSTEFLMTTMYERLSRGEELFIAMKDAQVASLNRPRRRHPFFWAAFNVLGDWRLQTVAGAK